MSVWEEYRNGEVGSKREVFHSWIIPSSCQDLYFVSEIIHGRRCRKEGGRKVRGLMDEKGAYVSGVQVHTLPHVCDGTQPASKMTTARRTQPVLAWNMVSNDFSMSESQKFTQEEPHIHMHGLKTQRWCDVLSFTWFCLSYFPEHSSQTYLPPSSARIHLLTHRLVWGF